MMSDVRRGMIAVPLVCTALAAALAAGCAASGEEAQEEEGPVDLGETYVALDGDIVLAWNELAQNIAFEEDQFLTFKGVRALAMMHLAMHDSLNTVFPLYDQYAYHHLNPLAHPVAAVAQAAHDVLASQYTRPDQLAQIDAELATWMGDLPSDVRTRLGVRVGHEAAVKNVAVRDGDGFDVQGTYTFQEGPGQYQNTPPFENFVVQPGFRFAHPFALTSPSQFRPPPPPALDSQAYADSYNEIKETGRLDSTTRTADQTGYAFWWKEFTEGSMNRLGRQIAEDKGTGLWPSARMFALLNMTMFDAYVANWDSKYEFNFWRPYTGIRAGDTDGNDATEPDPTWENLDQFTPPHPEYASAHATVCASSTSVLADTFGDHTSFTMTTTTAPADMPTRSFTSFSQAGLECADSRVRLGYHWRFSSNAGNQLGRSVAGYVISHKLKRHF
jgi:hypothetical protein